MGGYGSGRYGGRPTVEEQSHAQSASSFERQVVEGRRLDLRPPCGGRSSAPAKKSPRWAFERMWARITVIFSSTGLPRIGGAARRANAKTASRLRLCRSRSAVAVGFSSAHAPANAPRSCICRRGPTPSPVGRPIGLAIVASAERRATACPEPSHYAEKLATKEELATTSRSPRVCTRGLSNAPGTKSIGPRRSIITKACASGARR